MCVYTTVLLAPNTQIAQVSRLHRFWDGGVGGVERIARVWPIYRAPCSDSLNGCACKCRFCARVEIICSFEIGHTHAIYSRLLSTNNQKKKVLMVSGATTNETGTLLVRCARTHAHMIRLKCSHGRGHTCDMWWKDDIELGKLFRNRNWNSFGWLAFPYTVWRSLHYMMQSDLMCWFYSNSLRCISFRSIASLRFFCEPSVL